MIMMKMMVVVVVVVVVIDGFEIGILFFFFFWPFSSFFLTPRLKAVVDKMMFCDRKKNLAIEIYWIFFLFFFWLEFLNWIFLIKRGEKLEIKSKKSRSIWNVSHSKRSKESTINQFIDVRSKIAGKESESRILSPKQERGEGE